jgi:hypothetical protein
MPSFCSILHFSNGPALDLAGSFTARSWSERLVSDIHGLIAGLRINLITYQHTIALKMKKIITSSTNGFQ